VKYCSSIINVIVNISKLAIDSIVIDVIDYAANSYLVHTTFIVHVPIIVNVPSCLLLYILLYVSWHYADCINNRFIFSSSGH